MTDQLHTSRDTAQDVERLDITRSAGELLTTAASEVSARGFRADTQISKVTLAREPITREDIARAADRGRGVKGDADFIALPASGLAAGENVPEELRPTIAGRVLTHCDVAVYRHARITGAHIAVAVAMLAVMVLAVVMIANQDLPTPVGVVTLLAGAGIGARALSPLRNHWPRGGVPVRARTPEVIKVKDLGAEMIKVAPSVVYGKSSYNSVEMNKAMIAANVLASCHVSFAWNSPSMELIRRRVDLVEQMARVIRLADAVTTIDEDSSERPDERAQAAVAHWEQSRKAVATGRAEIDRVLVQAQALYLAQREVAAELTRTQRESVDTCQRARSKNPAIVYQAMGVDAPLVSRADKPVELVDTPTLSAELSAQLVHYVSVAGFLADGLSHEEETRNAA